MIRGSHSTISYDRFARLLAVAPALTGDYRAVGYDSGVMAPGGGEGQFEPGETVHVLRLDPLLTFQFNQTWSLLGGTVFEFSGNVIKPAAGGPSRAVDWPELDSAQQAVLRQ